MTDANSEAAQTAANGAAPAHPDAGQEQQQQSPAEAASRDNKAANVTGASTPAVRFSSAVQEFSPVQDDVPVASPGAPAESQEVTPEQLRAFTKSLQGPLLQERRLNTYQFEAFSLPPSRVPSRDEDSPDSTRLHTPVSSSYHSPHGSPRISALASPPLTPSGSAGERRARDKRPVGATGSDSHMITPLPSSSQEAISQERGPLVHRPVSDHAALRRSSSAEERLGDPRSHRKGMFSMGGGSVPVSRESSPSRSAASNFYSKPATPIGDLNDPYAKNRRPPLQSHPSRASIDPRFVFSKKKKHGSPGGSRSSLAGSGAFSTTKDDSSDGGSGHGHGHGHHHGSMADLKRFFRKSGHHKKRESSPVPAKTKTHTPPSSSRSTQLVPFADDHGLSSKYGKLGKVLGAGAGGSVRLMRRKEDGTVFAVKEFRARHTYESEKEYAKKVTAEFCVGSTLHHGNIIETLDILQEKGRWYEVMEYGPYDLFAIVMTGRMTREEVSCCFLQILNGVTYLHSLGLAHRDLKLDNVVVSEKGIMKIIDFGSAHVFKYPFETAIVRAKGIVGSDPYLAPEVYDQKEYDATAVDIWSLAIIYCCMSLRRFPWKLPRLTDNSFKLFASEPTPGHDPKKLIVAAPSTTASSANLSALSTREAEQRYKSQNDTRESGTTNSSGTTGDSKSAELKHEPNHIEQQEQQEQQEHQEQHDKHEDKHDAKPEAKPQEGEKKEIIRGPWRILRLLPRYSRHVIHRMLDLDPKKRAKMEEILEDSWVADTVICQQLEHGEVLAAEDHVHVLEPPNNPSS